MAEKQNIDLIDQDVVAESNGGGEGGGCCGGSCGCGN